MQYRLRGPWQLGTAGWALGAALLTPSPAPASDTFAGTRTGTLLERQHSIVMTLEPDRAELVVRRSVWNAGDVSDQVEIFLELPEGAVATRLRTRGIGQSAPWFEGELLEAEEAARRYKELTGIGGYYPKDPALLSWRDQRLLALQVFPCPPRAEKIIEYTLELPTIYERGAFRIKLPTLGTAELPARVQLTTKDPAQRLTVDGKPFPSGGALPSAPQTVLDIGLHAQQPLLDAELVSLPFASGRVLTRYAVRAAARVSTLPKRAQVVIVLDGSRSTKPEFEQAAKSAVDAYLSHLPDAQVELLTFDRHVRRQLGQFRSSAAARTALRSLTLQRHNGSDLDLALFQADQLLAQTPATAPRRVVLLTDGLTRQGLTPERVRGALAKSGAIVHIGLLHDGQPELSRLDDHVWADAIRSTGGLVWQASAPSMASGAQADREALQRTFEEWARPLRIDHIGTYSDNLKLADQQRLDSLPEGEGMAELYIDAAPTRNLRFTGELWSNTIRVAAERSESREAQWAALVFGSPTLYQLSEPEMMTLAVKGHAVSPVTSYLAIEPGVRPSTEGLEWGEIGTGFGRGASIRYGAASISGRAPALDLEAFLQQRLRAELARCGGAPGSAALDIETTLDEIVNVTATLDPADAVISSCIVEAAWSLMLPAAFHEEWATFRVDL